MKAATLSQSTSRIPQPAPYPLEGLTKTSARKTAVLVGLCFLVATFTFAIGSALIHSHFSSGTSGDGTLVAGVFLLACTGIAVVTNGLAMRSVLTPQTRLRSQAYLILRAVECLTIWAIGGDFLTSPGIANTTSRRVAPCRSKGGALTSRSGVRGRTSNRVSTTSAAAPTTLHHCARIGGADSRRAVRDTGGPSGNLGRRAAGGRLGALKDPMAIEVVDRLEYDFADSGRGARLHAVRVSTFDAAVRRFLGSHPAGTVVALGEGLETPVMGLAVRSGYWCSLSPIVGTNSDATYWGQRIAPLQRKLMFVPSAASKFLAGLE